MLVKQTKIGIMNMTLEDKEKEISQINNSFFQNCVFSE